MTNDVKSTSKNLETKKATTNKIASKESSKTMNIDDINEEDFSPNNYVLSDLIRILLIRELIGTSGNIIPTTSGFPPKRPDLFRTSDVRFDMQNYDIYEYMNI